MEQEVNYIHKAEGLAAQLHPEGSEGLGTTIQPTTAVPSPVSPETQSGMGCSAL